jgi:hypothetical protein
MLAGWRTQAEAEAARAEASRVVERWNQDLAAGRDIWWSPTIRVERIEILDPPQQGTEAAIVGATSLAIHCATASAIGQRRVAGGERVTRRPSGRSTASTLMTSVAMHCPGPVTGGDGSKAASSANRNWHGEGEPAVSDARD